MKEKNIWTEWSAKSSFVLPKMKKIDWIGLIVLVCIYAGIALSALGDKDAPQSYYEMHATGDTVTLTLPVEEHPVTRLYYFNGRYEKRDFYLEQSADNQNWYALAANGQDMNTLGGEAAKFTMTNVFEWSSVSFELTQPYVRLRSISDEAVINELVFLDDQGNMVTPLNANEYSNLFDESSLYPENGISTYKNGTYFDEIYHARTAYEMTLNVRNYEWTHPPLGKFIMSIGVRIFGMCPFGWRIMGTLIGIAMLPCFYFLTRRILKETWITLITTALFAFDFMHFTQTRIATIDVYVTFFIILMYWFMLQYNQMSFYDTPLKRTFLPLLCCGIATGLGCASKWTGIYATGGLAVLFLVTMLRRFLEYRTAWSDPKGASNGISNEKIIKTFKGNFIKTILFCVVAFIVIPAIIYTLSYIPFSDGTDRGLIQRMLKNQVDIWNYHSKLEATHSYSSVWYEWPIMKRPLWYYVGYVGEKQGNIYAFGNPLVWWAGIPAFVYLIYRSIRYRDRGAIFISVAYIAQLLPWIGVSRCTFIYHYFPSVPFVTIMVGYALYQGYCFLKKRGKSAELYGKIACVIYLMIAIGLFWYFYPILSGKPMDMTYVNRFLSWFDTSRLPKN